MKSLGMQGQLWSEVIRNPQNLTFMIFPRQVALEERVWHRANFETELDEVIRNETRKEEWQTFANLMGYKEFLRLDRLGVQYNIAPAGAKWVQTISFKLFSTITYLKISN